jgi:hypothetical protein
MARRPQWNRRFPEPIYLADGSVLRTLGDAANYLLKHKPPGAELAAVPSLLNAAEQNGSLKIAEEAVRLALFHKLDMKRSAEQ